MHGANRLASNSLLECFVFGVRLAEKVAQDLINQNNNQINCPKLTSTGESIDELKFIDSNTSNISQEAQTRIATIRQELRELAWRSAGICRDAETMETAIAQIQTLQQEISTLRTKTRLWVETHNLIDFAYLLVKSALFRTESRGAHFRLDFPNTKSAWQVHTVISNQDISAQ